MAYKSDEELVEGLKDVKSMDDLKSYLDECGYDLKKKDMDDGKEESKSDDEEKEPKGAGIVIAMGPKNPQKDLSDARNAAARKAFGKS
jgi:hypothetical protein